MAEHKHRWRMDSHVDSCHEYATVYTCTACAATMAITHERDPRHDPMQRIWMEPVWREITRDEQGRFITPRYEEVHCERCDALLAGARLRSRMTIVRRGEIIRETEWDTSQKEPVTDDPQPV